MDSAMHYEAGSVSVGGEAGGGGKQRCGSERALHFLLYFSDFQMFSMQVIQ